MTAPISFPNIAPPQLAPQTPGPLSGLGELLASIHDRSAQRAQESQRIDLERQRLEANKEQSKFDRTTKQNELDLRDLKVKADAIGERYAREFTLNPKPTSADLSETIGRMIAKEDPKLTPYLVDAFGAHVQENQKTLDSVAKRTTSESGARVAAGTEAGAIAGANANNAVAVETAAPKIAKAKTDAAQGVVDLANSKVEAEIHKLQLSDFGDAKQRQGATMFDQLLSAGLNAGQISDLTHTPLPPSIPRGYTRAPKASGNAQAVIAADMATAMGTANAAIKAAKSQGLSLPGLISATTGSTILQYLSASASSPEQQGLANNYLLYAQGLNHLVNSARASDKDFVRIMRTVTTYANEAPPVAAQKAVLRDLLPSLFEANAKGVSQSQALGNVIKEAQRRGVSSSVLAPFVDLKRQLGTAELTPQDSTSRNQQLLDSAMRPPR